MAGVAAPPFAVGSLKPPLTNAQRAAMVAYLATYSGSSVESQASTYSKIAATYGLIFNGATGAVTGPLGTSSQFDTLFISDYENVISHAPGTAGSGGGPGTIDNQLQVPGVSTITDFLGLLANKNTWIRIAEFSVGGILLAIGVSHLAGGSLGSAAGKVVSKSPVGIVGKAVSKPSRSGHTSYERVTSGKNKGVIKSRSNYLS